MAPTLALMLTFALSPLVLLVLRRFNVVDVPTARSSHRVVTPRGGGLALALGAEAAMALSGSFTGRAELGVAGAAIAFGGLGLVDDVVGIPALRRLALQFAVAVTALPLLLGAFEARGAWALALGALVVAWLVAYVNGFNFMDGIDGISVAQTVVAGLALFIVGRLEGLPAVEAGGAIVAAAAVGFAPFNVPRSSMFLGDVGAYFLGALLAGLTVLALAGHAPLEAVVAPLALYLADTGSTIVRRLHRRERWYEAHREHTYQRLVQLGWSHMRTTVFVAACMSACAIFGALSLGESLVWRAVGDVAIVVVLVTYLLVPRWLTRRADGTQAGTYA